MLHKLLKQAAGKYIFCPIQKLFWSFALTTLLGRKLDSDEYTVIERKVINLLLCFPASVIFKITQGLGAAVFYEERERSCL